MITNTWIGLVHGQEVQAFADTAEEASDQIRAQYGVHPTRLRKVLRAKPTWEKTD